VTRQRTNRGLPAVFVRIAQLFRGTYSLDVAAQGGQERTSHTRETIGTPHTRSPPDRR